MRLLISALSCHASLGSEALVGYRLCEAVNQRFDARVITSAGMQPPAGLEQTVVPIKFDDPNDVGPAQLLRYELAQRRRIGRLLQSGQCEVVHRVTPSGYKDSLLPVPSVPLILGPVLGSDPPPASFRNVFQPRLPRTYSAKAARTRIENGIARRVFRRFSTLPKLMENASIILAGTEVTRRNLPPHLQSRCRVVPYAGAEHEVFTPPAERTTDRRVRVLFVGRLVPYKGVELLLRAAAKARRRCRFELTIVGGGHAAYRTYCERLAAELRLTDTVSFTAHQPREQLPHLYRAADVFCMPSIETYGLAILEAMSSGCPPLVADFNGPGEIVQSGTGIKVPLKSPEQFIAEYAERIVELVEDRSRRCELGERAREHVVRNHDWSRIEADWLNVYDEVLYESVVGDKPIAVAAQSA